MTKKQCNEQGKVSGYYLVFESIAPEEAFAWQKKEAQVSLIRQAMVGTQTKTSNYVQLSQDITEKLKPMAVAPQTLQTRESSNLFVCSFLEEDAVCSFCCWLIIIIIIIIIVVVFTAAEAASSLFFLLMFCWHFYYFHTLSAAAAAAAKAAH